jgi:hypothetical protein
MFAHQVIDECQKMLKVCSGEEAKHIGDISCDIMSAIKFHIGEYEELVKLYGREKWKGTALFMFQDVDSIRLPYKLCWFDFITTGGCEPGTLPCSKRGLLVSEKRPDVLFVKTVTFWDHDKTWRIDAFGFVILINKTFKEIASDAPLAFRNTNILPVPLTKKAMSTGLFGMKQAIIDGQRDISALNLFLSFLSCKNIGTEKHYPPEALNKKRLKHHKQPLFTYHTLLLKPVGKKQESIPRHLWNNRIHFCRGHFKTYTEKNPLFGRITGRFWWQPAVRGRSREGVVMKDYKLDPPGASTHL